MKYLDAYRDTRAVPSLLDEIGRLVDRPRILLEFCGGQSLNLLRFGIDRELPDGFEIVHGPGCPVSAAPAEMIDRAVSIADRPGTIVAAPADLLRAPGRRGIGSLIDAKERGADVRAVYSPLDALALARKNPDREVVVVAVGFETTAPAAAAVIIEAERLGLHNFAALTAFFRISPAVEAILADPVSPRACAVLVPGPVCAVTGVCDYEPIAERFRVPIVVTGPGPVDLLDAIARAVRQLDRGSFAVENQYDRAVRPDGNPQARAAIDAAFELSDASWRGLGTIPGSGLILRDRFRRFDASFKYAAATGLHSADCPEAEIQSGRIKPFDCRAFGTCCTPEHPLGPFMVSAEGVCSAYYRHRRSADPAPSLSVAQTSATTGP